MCLDLGTLKAYLVIFQEWRAKDIKMLRNWSQEVVDYGVEWLFHDEPLGSGDTLKVSEEFLSKVILKDAEVALFWDFTGSFDHLIFMN